MEIIYLEYMFLERFLKWIIENKHIFLKEGFCSFFLNCYLNIVIIHTIVMDSFVEKKIPIQIS